MSRTCCCSFNGSNLDCFVPNPCIPQARQYVFDVSPRTYQNGNSAAMLRLLNNLKYCGGFRFTHVIQEWD